MQRSPSGRALFAGLFATLVVFAAIAYGPWLRVAFVGDDYVFLARVLWEPLRSVGSLGHVDFGWYRPWSRDVHFWVLSRLFGPVPLPFRLASLALWLGTLSLYALFVARISSWRRAAVATLGVASLILWGTPLLWVSGCQDLWMLAFTMGALLMFACGRSGWAAALTGLALLSKETAAVIPLLLFAEAVLVERERVAQALKRILPALIVLGAWAAVHPTLRSRLLMPSAHAVEIETRPGFLTLLLRTLGAHVNLDRWPRVSNPSAGFAETALLAAGVLAVATMLLMRATRNEQADGLRPEPGRTLAFGIVWAVLGSAPVLLPTIGWHAYYLGLGVFGSWLALSEPLARYPRWAVIALATLGALHTARADTPSWDWGDAWYQRRAASLVTDIQTALMARHPRLLHYTRVYFGRIPNNIGLVAGRSPAVRVWYRDSTLQADFYSGYRPRRPGEPSGPDLFFRFDSLRTLVEVGPDPDPAAAAARDPSWVDDHGRLAMTFLEAGDPVSAATTFERISEVPAHESERVLAGVCWQAAGDSVRAEWCFWTAAQLMNVPRRQVDAMAEELRRTMPRGSTTTPR